MQGNDGASSGNVDDRESQTPDISNAPVVDLSTPQSPAGTPPTIEAPDAEPPVVEPPTVAPPADPEPAEDPNTVFTPDASDIQDRASVYNKDGYAQADVIRVDLVTHTDSGTCEEGDQSGCTLDDVLQDTDSRDDFKVDIAVHFSATDFADDGSMTNAELRQRGGGARYAPQKSFRIRLDDKEQLWRGERHLQLNKHPFENSRIRNKLSFDLMSDIPHLPSFRTQFVNLWIDDGDGAVNFGLYTHVERADERYLKRRNLDNDGRLYKAEFFRFRESDRKTLLIDEDGEPLDEDLFETVLEIENGKDHRNLVAMLDALHDPEQSFDSVMDRYFNENNVLTWVTVNLLIGQQDATRHNYFLYNPEDSEKFYFIPWDYDSTFEEQVEPANEFTAEALKDRLGYGYALGSNNEFLEAYYRRPGTHERILAAAAELRQTYLSDVTVAQRADELAVLTFPYVSAQPDIEYNPYYSDKSSADFASKVAFNHDAMINNFSVPLPPTLAEPELNERGWILRWKPALELTGHRLTYELQVASSPEFRPDDIAFIEEDIEYSDDIIEYVFNPVRLRSNTKYYARLIAQSVNEPERYWQVADNQLVVDGERYYGMVELDD